MGYVLVNMDLLGQSSLILAVTSFSLAITVLSRNIRNKLGLAFAALCAVVFGWSFFFVLEKVFATGTFYKLHLTFNLLLGPVGLFFVRVFTRVSTRAAKNIMAGSLVYSAVCLPALWIDFELSWVAARLAVWSTVFLIFDVIHLVYRDILVKRGEAKAVRHLSTVGFHRRTWVFVGAFVILITCTMDHIAFMGDVVPSLGNVFLCLYLFFISEAVTQQRLLNFTGLLNRVLVLVFLSLCLTVIYTLLVAWIQNSPGLFILNTFLASFIILMLIDPIKKLTNFGVRQLFYRQQLKLEEKVDDYQMQLTGILEPHGLSQLTLNMLDTTLQVESATVFILRSDGAKFRRIRGLRDDDLDAREILATHPLVEFFIRMKRRGETPAILDTYLENEIDRSVSQTLKQSYEMILLGLRGMRSNLLMPFMTDQTVLGFVAVRAPVPPEPWGGNWGVLSVIYPFFLQAARTLKNMDIYVRLREKDRLAALGEMSAGLAHEIRNPLAAIKGATQLLEGNRALKESPYTQVIIEEVGRLNKVVTQFLDYARSAVPEMTEFNLGQIIERTIDLSKTAPTAGVDVLSVPPEDGYDSLPKVFCNPEQIKQVLVNLVQNATRAVAMRLEQDKINKDPTPEPGRVVITAKKSSDYKGKSELLLIVEDNGVGIPKESIDKIFIPFYTTNPSGTGLGLSICARIIEAHGGRIDVASEEGRLTRFTIHLPTETTKKREIA
jgi:signal transduction histidine kinase